MSETGSRVENNRAYTAMGFHEVLDG
ncbi:hypothetical protein EYZ11_004991 [Aspergillus tanneri]|uniref:Uncharacterized protein n=1 Tax=Aspergillus tanneri TaxID=1220188 RepID=A0A4S3JJ09_9EURO|nr:hypothetical protein EYZ11_004991 [Aspergillus tanneri]